MSDKQFHRGQSVYRTDTDPPCWTYFHGWAQAGGVWQRLHASRRGYVMTPDGGPDVLVSEEHLHDRETKFVEWEQPEEDVWDRPAMTDEDLDADLEARNDVDYGR